MTEVQAAPVLAYPGTTYTVRRVVGLDASLTSFGAALACTGAVPQLHRWRPRNKGHERLDYLTRRMLDVCTFIDNEAAPRGLGADLVVLEGLAYGAKGRGILDLAGLHWVLRQALWDCGQPYVVMPPALRAKWLTGKGNASKDECLIAAIKRFPAAAVDGNDVADALTLAAMGMEHLGQPLAKMPADRRELLYTLNREHKPQIDWPSIAPGSPENHE